MDEIFELPIIYKGTEMFLAGKLIVSGYSYKIEMEIQGRKVYFEPDEEKNFRVFMNDENDKLCKPIDNELLSMIAAELLKTIS